MPIRKKIKNLIVLINYFNEDFRNILILVLFKKKKKTDKNVKNTGTLLTVTGFLLISPSPPARSTKKRITIKKKLLLKPLQSNSKMPN